MLSRVLAQVSSEVVCPPPNRPSEGQLFFNLELSPMASPAYETGRYDCHIAKTLLLTDSSLPLSNF